MPGRKRSTITEAQLRRIIRDELSRRVLVQEGFLDAVKNPFKKLGDKAKEWVMEKSTELASKAVEAAKALKVPDDMKQFISDVESAEGGVPMSQLMSMAPGLSDSKAELEALKDLDLKQLIEQPTTKAESFSYSDARLAYILAEEKYLQKVERSPLNESVLMGALGAWYTFAKTVVTTLGLVVFLLEGGEKITKMLG